MKRPRIDTAVELPFVLPRFSVTLRPSIGLTDEVEQTGTVEQETAESSAAIRVKMIDFFIYSPSFFHFQ
jgi:hypothetical protein